MKKLDLQKLIREEVRKVIKENVVDPQSMDILSSLEHELGGGWSMTRNTQVMEAWKVAKSKFVKDFDTELDKMSADKATNLIMLGQQIIKKFGVKISNQLKNQLKREGYIQEVGKVVKEAQFDGPGTGIPEAMWPKELIGKKIVKASVKTSGPDLIIKCEDGSMYTIKHVAGLVRW